MKMDFRSLIAFALFAFHAFSYADSENTDQPMVAAEIPLVNCTADKAWMSINFASINREVSLGQKLMQPHNEIVGIVDRYKGKQFQNKPIKDFLSIEETQRFDELSSRIIKINLKTLAESQFQRDTEIIYAFLTFARTEHIDKLDPAIMKSIKLAVDSNNPNLNSDDAKKYTYLFSIKKKLGDFNHPDEENRSVCSLGLALEHEYTATTLELNKLLDELPEMKIINGLAIKHNVSPQDLDKINLSPDEVKTLRAAQSDVTPIFKREMEYLRAITAIRYFSNIVTIKYLLSTGYIDSHKTIDINEMNKDEAVKLKDTSKEIKEVLEIWSQIDRDFPSLQTKSDKRTVDMRKIFN